MGLRGKGLFFDGVEEGCFFEFAEFGTDDDHAVGLMRIVGEVILVVALGGVELRERGNFGDDGVAELGGGGIAGLESSLFLGLVVIKNDAAILRANVGTLAIEGGGVVGFPEDLKQLLERDHRGIENDAHDLCVASIAAADVVVGRILCLAARIATDDALHTTKALENGFNTPEAPTAKSGLGLGW